MTGEGPVTDSLTITRQPEARFGIYSLRAQITDAASGEAGQNIAAAEAYVDVPPWRAGAVAVPLTAEDGNFNTPTRVCCRQTFVSRRQAYYLCPRTRRRRQLGPRQSGL